MSFNALMLCLTRKSRSTHLLCFVAAAHDLVDSLLVQRVLDFLSTATEHTRLCKQGGVRIGVVFDWEARDSNDVMLYENLRPTHLCDFETLRTALLNHRQQQVADTLLQVEDLKHQAKNSTDAIQHFR